MNGNTETVKASSTMLKEFLARDKKKMILIRIPAILLLLASLPCLDGYFGWLEGMQIGWGLLVLSFVWFGVATKLEANGKKANAIAEQLLSDELAAAQAALDGCPMADAPYTLVSAQYVIGEGARVRRTGAARDGYLSSVALGSAIAFEKRSGGVWLYRRRFDIVSGNTDTYCELIPFDSIEDIKVALQEYGEKRTVYKKLMRFDITVGGEDIWLLFDENYDSKRAADELIKLFGD